MSFGDKLKALQESTRANADRKKAEVATKQTVKNAAKVLGKPWWESALTVYVCAYSDVDQLNGESAIAAPLGWEIASTTSQDGHIHVGRALFTGGLTLLAKGGRSKERITVTWKRS